MEKFLGDQVLWATLKKAAKGNKGRRFVAVAYVGHGATKILPLRRNDVLICALSEPNVKNGSVCPAEIRAFQKKGVKVYQQDNLHAKVYLLGNTVFVASANLSVHSASMDEAGLLSRRAEVRNAVRQWFRDRLNQPITPEWLSHCESVYRSPRVPGRRRPQKNRPGPSHTRQNIWLVGVHPVEYPEDESDRYEKGLEVAKHRIGSPRKWCVDEIRWTGDTRFVKEVQRGDLVVQVWTEEDGKRMVCPHGRLLAKKRFKNRKGTQVTYVYLEMPKKYRRISWDRFKSFCRTLDVKLGNNISARQVREPLIQREILNLTSPERLRK